MDSQDNKSQPDDVGNSPPGIRSVEVIDNFQSNATLPSVLTEDPGSGVSNAVRMDSSTSEMSIPTTTTNTPGDGQRTIVSIPSEDDEDIRKAKAMALAIQSNPNMTPEEIRQLLVDGGYENEPLKGSQHEKEDSSKSTLMPGLANMISSSMPPLPAIPPLPDTTKNFRERARGRFHEIMGSKSSDSHGSAEGKDSSIKRAFRPKPVTVRTPPVSPVPTDGPVVIRSVAPKKSNVVGPPLTRGDSDPSFLNTVPSSDSIAALQQDKSTPIRISGIAWKRRGGMGKFSTTAAWERRRIELQGSKLLYYSRDASEEDSVSNMHSVVEDDSSRGPGTPMSIMEDSIDPITEGVVVNKRATWLEQAASQWVAGADDPTSPRGYIDLAKEKASVHVSYGDNGAPSPFAISIKVRGETRWKLCFDYHRTQMDWLAALTDAVVQASVDSYNLLLLQQADPSHQSDTLIFQPPVVGQPPSREANGAQRLWMTDSYVVSSDNTVDGEAPEHRSPLLGSTSAMRVVESSRGDSNQLASVSRGKPSVDIQDEIALSAKKSMVLCEANIVYTFLVLNAALVYARKSNTTLEGFWYVVILSNLGLLLCLQEVPDWRSVLDHASYHEPGMKETKQVSGENVEQVTSEIQEKSKSQIAISPDGFKPKAGQSGKRLEHPKDSPLNEKGAYCAPFRAVPGNSILVRSIGYATTKEKITSPGELYELIEVDAFESSQRYPDIANRVKLPETGFTESPSDKTWRAPDLFVWSFCLPTDPPKLGRSTNDGGGVTLTLYCRMKKETRDILRRVTADGYDPASESADDPQKSIVNAVRLFEEWCRRAPTDPKWFSRFKVVPVGNNLEELGLPVWITKYNNKPFLIKRQGQTGFMHSHPEQSCLGFEVSLHPFPYLAKQAICFLKDKVSEKMLLTIGFLIEGKTDDEVSIY